MRTLRLALLLFLAAPAAARAGDATITSQDLPIGVVRTTEAAVAPVRFDLVAFHWQGPGHVLFKTRSQAGSWSGWRRADPEGEDVPDRGSTEARGRPGWHLGNPYWVGPSDRIAYRLGACVLGDRSASAWSSCARGAENRRCVREQLRAGGLAPRDDDRSHASILRRSGAEDGELVATETCERLVCTHLLTQASSERLQQHITGLVPERVVDFLEVVDVEEHHGCRAGPAP